MYYLLKDPSDDTLPYAVFYNQSWSRWWSTIELAINAPPYDSEYLSPLEERFIKYLLLASSTTPITQQSHPELFL